ncbi:GDP-fucose protein O-fucosyltransferase 3 isoform 3-T6 [Megaptera novaeangliae]
MVRIQRRKLLASCLCITATVFLFVTLQVVVELGKFEGKKFKNSNWKDGRAQMEEEPMRLHPFLKRGGLTLNRKKTLAADSYPIMLWWSPLTGENGRLGQCGADTCFFTINRTYLHHHRTKAFLFYGLTTQTMEGRHYPPELSRAYSVCFLTPRPTLELFARDVDTKLPTIQERSPSTKEIPKQEMRCCRLWALGTDSRERYISTA